MPDDDDSWEHPGRAQRWRPEEGDVTDNLFPLSRRPVPERRRTRHPVRR